MAFPKFPYTDFHRLNADWILDTMRKLVDIIKQKSEDVDTAVETVEGYNTRLTAAEGDIDNLESSRVSYAAQQQLNSTQQQTARGNIGAAPSIGVVYYNQAMVLGDSYKAQARDNIGAISSEDIPTITDAVRVVEQTFTTEQKAQARTNIGAASTSDIPTGTVRYDASQSLTATQKTQARTNIGAASASDVQDNADQIDSLNTAVGYAVKFTSQTLTDSQKLQARANIYAEEKVTQYVSYESTQSFSAQNNYDYQFSTLTSLAVTGSSESGMFSITFHSGSTPTTTSFPVNILGLDDFVPEANTTYEINVKARRAVWASWADPVEE